MERPLSYPVHSKLPWRLTEPSEKKGHEIVSADGFTVAKLMPLDPPNAELIIESVNRAQQRDALFEFIKHGDERHQEWLREAIDAFYDGKPRPAI